jgi:5-methylcytosine-specific restriction protein A
MPKQICASRPHCAHLVEIPTRFCESCVASGAGKDQRPSASQRLYGPEWQRARRAYLDEHPIAVDIFHRHGGRKLPAEEVDHIVRHQGDLGLFWDRSNWQGLTKSDHSRKTALERCGKWQLPKK